MSFSLTVAVYCKLWPIEDTRTPARTAVLFSGGGVPWGGGIPQSTFQLSTLQRGRGGICLDKLCPSSLPGRERLRQNTQEVFVRAHNENGEINSFSIHITALSFRLVRAFSIIFEKLICGIIELEFPCPSINFKSLSKGDIALVFELLIIHA